VNLAQWMARSPSWLPASTGSSRERGRRAFETLAESRGGLHFGDDQYIYVWKTARSWAGSCRQLVVRLDDGTVHRAQFGFRRG